MTAGGTYVQSWLKFTKYTELEESDWLFGRFMSPFKLSFMFSRITLNINNGNNKNFA